MKFCISISAVILLIFGGMALSSAGERDEGGDVSRLNIEPCEFIDCEFHPIDVMDCLRDYRNKDCCCDPCDRPSYSFKEIDVSCTTDTCLEENYFEQLCLEETLSREILEARTSERILIVVAPFDYNDTEYLTSRNYFEEQGFDVNVTSKNVTIAKGMEGGEAEISANITDINISDFVAIIFIGGIGVENLKLYDDPDYLQIAREAVDSSAILGAVSQAEKILANARLLDGKEAASYPEAKDYLEEMGAVCLDQPVVQDENIITANGPSASQPFAETVVEALKALRSE